MEKKSTPLSPEHQDERLKKKTLKRKSRALHAAELQKKVWINEEKEHPALSRTPGWENNKKLSREKSWALHAAELQRKVWIQLDFRDIIPKAKQCSTLLQSTSENFFFHWSAKITTHKGFKKLSRSESRNLLQTGIKGGSVCDNRKGKLYHLHDILLPLFMVKKRVIVLCNLILISYYCTNVRFFDCICWNVAFLNTDSESTKLKINCMCRTPNWNGW